MKKTLDATLKPGFLAVVLATAAMASASAAPVTIFSDDFSGGATNWSTNSGIYNTWSVVNTAYQNHAGDANLESWAVTTAVALPSNWVYDVDLKWADNVLGDGYGGFGIILAAGAADPTANYVRIMGGQRRPGWAPDGITELSYNYKTATGTRVDGTVGFVNAVDYGNPHDYHLTVLRVQGSSNLSATLTGGASPLSFEFAFPNVADLTYIGLSGYMSVIEFDNVTLTTVPEPSAILGLLIGGISLFGFNRQRIK